MKLTKVIAAFLLMIFAVSSADAQTQSSQRRRTRQGVRNGEINRAERAVIAHQQNEIRKDKRDARADGTVTRDERKEIKQDKRKASRSIARKKHNRRDRN